MAEARLSVTPGFALLAAFLYYAGGGAALTAFCTAALAHELGHLAALWLADARVCRVRLTACGAVIEYAGAVSARQETGIAAAGPLAGLVFAAFCLLTGSAYFRYAGLIALFSAAFNLLPVLPMDGGRLALALLRTALPERTALLVMRILGSVCGAAVLAAGLCLGSPAMAAAGLWMTALANVPELR